MERQQTMLWLTKAYALPASMYACHIWSTIYMKEGAEMDSPMQTVHVCLLKRLLGLEQLSRQTWSQADDVSQNKSEDEIGTLIHNPGSPTQKGLHYTLQTAKIPTCVKIVAEGDMYSPKIIQNHNKNKRLCHAISV
eukprot:1139359-Pelagomonas_calceolata.AAC.1